MSEIDEVIVYGKVPRRSIAIPTITGGTFSPGFIYVVKRKDGTKELNLVVETKDVEKKGDLREEEKLKIKYAEIFFKKIPNIRKDMAEGDRNGPDDDTIASYLNALRKIFVIEDMEAWCPALRSKSVVRTTDTRYFSDSSIATAAMGLGPGDLMNDIRAYGWYFETMAVRDLRVYADALNGHVAHYLDRNRLECDAVVHLRNGTSGLVEIKLGGEALIEEGAKTLNELSGLIDTSRQKEVAFKMVITATGDCAYQRPDGVIVCPLSALRA